VLAAGLGDVEVSHDRGDAGAIGVGGEHGDVEALHVDLVAAVTPSPCAMMRM
jgi:hypothetical protein